MLGKEITKTLFNYSIGYFNTFLYCSNINRNKLKSQFLLSLFSLRRFRVGTTGRMAVGVSTVGYREKVTSLLCVCVCVGYLSA